MKHIGLFGGTFNPIHLGHLRVTQEVKEAFALDKICFIPSALPPHKAPMDMADAKDRFEMIRLALTNRPDFIVSDVELKRSGLSYTIDTIYHFQKALQENSHLYLVLGLDAFLDIASWRAYQELFQLIPMIVMTRPGSLDDTDTGNGYEKIIEAYLKANVSEDYQFSASASCCVHPENQQVHIFKVTPLDISSTRIRSFIREGISIRFLVTENVANYINTQGLYR